MADKKRKHKKDRCWLCGLKGAETVISVACDVPNGKPTKPHEVRVHFGCYMDMPF